MKKQSSRLLIIIMSMLLVVTSGCGYQSSDNSDGRRYSWHEREPYEDDDDDEEDESDGEDDPWGDGNSDAEEDDGENEEWVDDEEEEEETDDSFQMDEWKFSNSALDEKVGVNGYYISEEDYCRLVTNLPETELSYLFWRPTKDENGDFAGYLRSYCIGNSGEDCVPWNGSCYGMSMAAALVNRNILSPEDLNVKSKLNNADLDRDIFSAINFYFWQQELALCREARAGFMKLDSIEQLELLASQARREEPFEIDFYWTENGNSCGHSVLGYGYEKGKWSWSNGTYSHIYNTRILIYDCNAPYDTTGNHDIYIDVDEGLWCLPAYGIMSNSNNITEGDATDNGKLGSLQAVDDFLNAVDYKTGELSDDYKAVLYEGAKVVVQIPDDQKVDIESTTGSASLNGLIVSDSSYGDNIQVGAIVGGPIQSVEAYIPQGEKYYKISSEKPLCFGMDVGNYFISMKSDASGEFEFRSDGSMDVKLDSKAKECDIEVTCDDENAFGIKDCHTVEIDASKVKELTIKPTTSGVVIDGDNLSDVSLNGQMYGKENTITADTKGSSLEVSLEKSNLVVKTDISGNGKYDTVVSKNAIPKNTQSISIKDKKATYTGKNINIAKAKLTGVESKKIVYAYYKDKQCKIETKAHKNVGTYYVKAYVLNDNGTFSESNIAKLKITKSAGKIVPKTKKVDFSASKLKKNTQKSTIKVLAKCGKVNYKKVTGNKNFSVSKDGVITAKKGTPKGDYSIKVKAWANENSNYKKVSKTFVVMVKVK